MRLLQEQQSVAADQRHAKRLSDKRPLHGLTLLLIEDDPDALFLLRFHLQASGARVISAMSGVAALECLKVRNSVDAIVCDISLPDGSGLDLMHAIRESGIRIPAIALTGRSAVAWDTAGFQACLLKPVDLDKLMSLLVKDSGESDTAYSAEASPPEPVAPNGCSETT